MRFSRCVVLLAVVVLCACTGAFATEYFVATNGLDTNPGTIDQPWLTITHAMSAMAAGDTISVRAGTYNEDLRPRVSGNAGAWITIRSYDGDRAAYVTGGMNVMYQSYLRIIGFESSAASAMPIHIQPASDISLRSSHIDVLRCYFHAPARYDGVKLNQSDYILFEDCEITGDTGDEEVDAVWVNYMTFRRCFIHDYATIGFTAKGGCFYPILEQTVIAHALNAGDKASRFGGATDARFRDPNSLYASQYGVFRNNIYKDCRAPACGDYESWYSYFYNNDVVDCGSTSGIINHHADPKYSGDGGSRHIYWFNNVFLDTTGDMPPVWYKQSNLPYEDWLTDYNNYYNNGNPIPVGAWPEHDPNQEPNSTFGNPNLADQNGTATTYAGWKDCFRITSASTLLIDRGTSAAGNDPQPAVHNDMDGNPRPQGAGWDIGAFELVSGPVPPVANFSGNPTSGPVPLAVAFTDTSLGSPTSWSWTFGDGGTSTAQSPSHTYTSANSYTVALTATNAQGSNTNTKTNYITAVQAQDYFCASATVNTGTLQSGDHTSVHASDNVYLVVASAKVQNKQTAQVTYSFSTGLGSLSLLSFTAEGKVSAGTQPQTVYVYNYSTSTWDSKSTSTLTTSDTTATATVASPASYISGGTVQVRVKAGGSGSTAFTHSTDLVKITAAP